MPVTFLAPWLLLASVAIAVPIVIHLLQRRREVILPFSMVRFVLLARKRSARRLKLRRLLLLAARVTAILLLALLVARPVLTSPASSLFGETAGRTVVIVDNSLSMAAGEGTGRRFRSLRAMVEDYTRSATAEELFSLVPAAAMGGSVAGGSWMRRSSFQEEVDRVEVLPHRGDLPGAFKRAYGLLREDGPSPGRIAVFTDLARGSWSDFSYLSLPGADPSVPVTLFRVGEESDVHGAGILGVNIEGRERVAGQRIRLEGRILNHGPETSLPVELFVNGAEADRKVVDIPAGGEGVAAFFVEGLGEGSHRVEMRVRPDGYREDDSRLAGLRLGPPVRVLLVDGDPRFTLVESETFFLREALRSERLSGGEPVETHVVEAENLAAADLAAYDVVVLANAPAPAGGEIADFVTRGGGLVIFWGENCDAREYTASLGTVLPVRPIDPVSAAPGSPFRIGEVDFSDHMLSVFEPPGGGTLATASFFRKAVVGGELAGTAVTARFDDGSPWIVRGRAGDGEVVFFASSADLEWNDLPTKPVFVPLLRRLVMELAGGLGATWDGSVEAGSDKVFPGKSADTSSAVTVTDPGGKVGRTEFRALDGGAEARFAGTKEVGFYSYLDEEGREGVFAVNPPAAESDLQSLAEEDVKSRFQQIPLGLYSPGRRGGEADFFQRGSRSLARPLLAGLFLLLVLEMVIAGPRVFPGRRTT
jgi:hypothetical protein